MFNKLGRRRDVYEDDVGERKVWEGEIFGKEWGLRKMVEGDCSGKRWVRLARGVPERDFWKAHVLQGDV